MRSAGDAAALVAGGELGGVHWLQVGLGGLQRVRRYIGIVRQRNRAVLTDRIRVIHELLQHLTVRRGLGVAFGGCRAALLSFGFQKG